MPDLTFRDIEKPYLDALLSVYKLLTTSPVEIGCDEYAPYDIDTDLALVIDCLAADVNAWGGVNGIKNVSEMTAVLSHMLETSQWGNDKSVKDFDSWQGDWRQELRSWFEKSESPSDNKAIYAIARSVGLFGRRMERRQLRGHDWNPINDVGKVHYQIDGELLSRIEWCKLFIEGRIKLSDIRNFGKKSQATLLRFLLSDLVDASR